MTTPSHKVYLITGANCGLGFQCSLALARRDHTRVIVAGRSQERVDEAVAAIQREAAASSTVESGVVDLSSLESVRRFADDLIARDVTLTTLVCNAGIQPTSQTMTQDGFESAVGVNHVGHFLLVKLLQSRTQRIVVVSSGLHDADDLGKPSMTVHNMEEVARGRDPFHWRVAYSDSKLCNMAFAKEFVRRFPQGPEMLVYTPGFTSDTGLHRGNKMYPVLKHVLKVFYWTIRDRTNTSEGAGATLADLTATESIASKGWRNGDYVRIDAVHQASALSCDPALGRALWTKSEEWVQKFAQ